MQQILKSKQKIILTLLRVSLGWVFLWPFLDKTFGLGFSTAPESAWLAGASPTKGFLSYGTSGPLTPLFQSLAGNIVVDWLFMLGLLGVGCALILGIGIRVASISGSVLMALIYLAALFPEHNPVIDDHIIYILVLAYFYWVKPSKWYGYGEWWQELPLVQQYPFLK